MKKIIATLFLLVSILALNSSMAFAVVVGGPGESSNCFPFGCGKGTVYQQVYNSKMFSGPITISSISFYNTISPGGNINSGTYTLSLSTTNAAVNGLNTTDFNANLGSNNQLFTSTILNGVSAPSQLDFFGTAFDYNPNMGNLLLDIRTTITGTNLSSSYFDALSGTAGTMFSRAHNFGTGFEGFGLVTGFNEANSAPVPEPSTMLLLGGGLAGLAFWRRKQHK